MKSLEAFIVFRIHSILDLYAEKQMNQHLLISIGLVTFKKTIFFFCHHDAVANQP